MKFKPSSCSCARCRGACEHKPCFPTSDEARRLHAAHPDKMVWDVSGGMLVDGVVQVIPVLRPAAVGEIPGQTYAAVNAPCMFFNNGCALHGTDLKPLEGRLMSHKFTKKQIVKLRRHVTEMWATFPTKGAQFMQCHQSNKQQQ